MDVLAERDQLFLGSRLKRVAERMQSDVIRIVEAAGLSIQPSQFPLLATLDRAGPMTIGGLVHSLKLSQPAVTRIVGKLVAANLVETSRQGSDLRHKIVSLTAEGTAAIARSKVAVWPQVEAAVSDLLSDIPNGFREALDAVETRLTARGLDKRVPETGRFVIREFDDSLAAVFRSINLEWIEAMYMAEDADRDVLDHPRERIIDLGGVILFVEKVGIGVVGTCALRKTGEHQYELTKMGVLTKARGSGAGAALLEAAIVRAQALGAKRLYLLSNTASAAGIHLYEKHGFVHDDGIMAEFGAGYARCNVAMLWQGADHSTKP